MTNAQLVKALSLQAGISNVQAENALQALAVVATQELKNTGGEVYLVGLGKLKSITRPARTVNQFGKTVLLPARTAIKFTVSSVLKGQLV